MNLINEIDRILNLKGLKKKDFYREIKISEEEFISQMAYPYIKIELYEKIKAFLEISQEEFKGLFIDIGFPKYMDQYLNEQIQETIRWRIEAYRLREQLQKYEPEVDFMFGE